MAKAISSLLSDAFVFVFRLLVFIVFGNPLSMCVLNLLAPRKTAKFARNPHYFGPKLSAFYERQALKWPFHRAKWWMKLEDLSKYSVNRQIKYFFRVAFKNKTEVETLKAMQKDKTLWPKAYDRLFFHYGKKCLPIKESRELKSKNGASRKTWYINTTVAEFMMMHVRLSYDALEAVINQASDVNDCTMRYALKQYLDSGKINDAQLRLLLNGVIAADKSDSGLDMCNVLRSYISHFGLSDENLILLEAALSKDHFARIKEEADCYKNFKAVRSFKDTEDGRKEWRTFCKETPKILPAVQGEMNLRQYYIFHNVGHVLDKTAAMTFLHRPDKELWRAMFEREPNFGYVSDDVRRCIEFNPEMKALRKEVIKKANSK